MRKILALAWNDIQLEFSERATLVFFFILPLVFTAIIGVALQNTYSSASEDARLPVVVVNEDQGDYAVEFIALLDKSDTVRVVAADAQTAAEMDADEYPVVLTIPADFSQRLAAGELASLELYKSPSSTAPTGIEQAVNTAVDRLGAALTIAEQATTEAEKISPFASPAERQTFFDTSLAAARTALDNPPTRSEVTLAEKVNTQQIATGFEQSSPGQLVTWVMITLLGGSEVFVNERLKGTLRRLLTTPSTRGTILTGKITGRFILGIIQMALLVGFGAAVLGVNWGQSPAALIIMLVSFGLAGTAFGVMLGALARTRRQASGLTTLFSMLLAALGGAWWPLEVTPPAYQAAVKVIPTSWAMTGFTDVILRGQGVSGILLEAGVLLGFAAIFFAIGVWKLRFE
ncbi:MAG TPA: ABC transporter permease [Anaerolineaceae bacterium]|nr:ABC transporter permease [Anaerolineaceae bacterium]